MEVFKLNQHRIWEGKVDGSYLDFLPTQDFVEIHDCLVDGRTGLVGFKNGELVNESLLEYVWWKPEWIGISYGDELQRRVLKRVDDAKEGFRNSLTSKKIINLDENHVYISLLHPHAIYSFGHLFDTLAKLNIAEKNLPDLKNIALLTSDYSLIQNFDKYIDILTGSKIKIVDNRFSDEDGFPMWACKKLILIKPKNRPANFTQETFDYVDKKFEQYYSLKKAENFKLFLARRSGYESRYIVNFDEIKTALEAAGVVILYGNEPLDEIYRHFACATHVAGYHGSLFANLIYSKEHAMVLEFCSSTREDVSFMVKYKKKMSYTQLLIKADENNNANLDVEMLLNFYKH